MNVVLNRTVVVDSDVFLFRFKEHVLGKERKDNLNMKCNITWKKEKSNTMKVRKIPTSR